MYKHDNSKELQVDSLNSSGSHTNVNKNGDENLTLQLQEDMADSLPLKSPDSHPEIITVPLGYNIDQILPLSTENKSSTSNFQYLYQIIKI